MNKKGIKYWAFIVIIVVIGYFSIAERTTPLMTAAKEGNIQKVREEIAKNSRINKKGPEGVTALMLAAKNGESEVVSALIEAGAAPNLRSNYGWTALMFGSVAGSDEVVETLLKAGADPNVTSMPVPSAFETVGDYPATNALSQAIHANVSTAKILISHGANIDKSAVASAVSEEEIGLLDYFWKQNSDFSESLCSAISMKGYKKKSLIWLLKKGVDPNTSCISVCDSTDIHYSYLSDKERLKNNALSATRILVENGAEVDVICDDRAYETPLRNSLGNRNIELTRYLLENGADPNRPILYGTTVLFDAYNVEVAKLLVSHGADKNHAGDNGWDAAKSIQHNLELALERQPETTSNEYVKERKELIGYLRDSDQ